MLINIMESIINTQIDNNNNLIDLLKILNTNLLNLKTIDENNIDKLRLINNNYEIVQSNIYSILNDFNSLDNYDDINLRNSLKLEKITNDNLKKILPLMLGVYMSFPNSHWSS